MKQHSEFVCQQCGYKSSAFLGKCPQCGQWNSLVETVVSDQNLKSQISNLKFEGQIVKLSDVKSQQVARLTSGFGEFDRVLGGGIVPGSIVLVAGDPGIGKSTLLLQVAMQIVGGQVGKLAGRPVGEKWQTSPVLYVTGEESPQQVKIRADRLIASSQSTVHSSQKVKKTVNRELLTDNLYILPQTNVETAVAASAKLNPRLLIIDSIQTLTSDNLSGPAGSVGQVRETAQILQAYAKSSDVPIFMVGHVTKEGSVAGPKVLEHLVDVVLNLEGDHQHNFRILRAAKNRFGSTFEVGVFEMSDAGMRQVDDPSGVFLAQRIEARPGSVVASTVTGQRPILAEIQALTTSTLFGIPTRRVAGLDFARVQVVIAALSKTANLSLANLDIYVNVAGGLKISEPAADLPVALSVVSAVLSKPIKTGTCVFGEVGLLGELRPVTNSKNRMSEAKRLGFADFVTAERFATLEEAIGYAIHEG